MSLSFKCNRKEDCAHTLLLQQGWKNNSGSLPGWQELFFESCSKLLLKTTRLGSNLGAYFPLCTFQFHLEAEVGRFKPDPPRLGMPPAGLVINATTITLLIKIEG